jgi:hypothetical protein
MSIFISIRTSISVLRLGLPYVPQLAAPHFFETIALRLDRPNGTEVCALERAPSTSSVLFRQFFQVTTLQSCDFQPHAHFNRTTLTIGRFTGQSFPSSPGVEFALHLFFRGAYAMSSTAR